MLHYNKKAHDPKGTGKSKVIHSMNCIYKKFQNFFKTCEFKIKRIRKTFQFILEYV